MAMEKKARQVSQEAIRSDTKSMIMTRYFAAYRSEAAGEIETRPSVKLSHVVSIHLLPRCCVFGRYVKCGRVPLIPFSLWDHCIDAARGQIDAHAISCSQFGQAATRERFGRCVQDRWTG